MACFTFSARFRMGADLNTTSICKGTGRAQWRAQLIPVPPPCSKNICHFSPVTNMYLLKALSNGCISLSFLCFTPAELGGWGKYLHLTGSAATLVSVPSGSCSEADPASAGLGRAQEFLICFPVLWGHSVGSKVASQSPSPCLLVQHSVCGLHRAQRLPDASLKSSSCLVKQVQPVGTGLLTSLLGESGEPACPSWERGATRARILSACALGAVTVPVLISWESPFHFGSSLYGARGHIQPSSDFNPS